MNLAPVIDISQYTNILCIKDLQSSFELYRQLHSEHIIRTVSYTSIELCNNKHSPTSKYRMDNSTRLFRKCGDSSFVDKVFSIEN